MEGMLRVVGGVIGGAQDHFGLFGEMLRRLFFSNLRCQQIEFIFSCDQRFLRRGAISEICIWRGNGQFMLEVGENAFGHVWERVLGHAFLRL